MYLQWPSGVYTHAISLSSMSSPEQYEIFRTNTSNLPVGAMSAWGLMGFVWIISFLRMACPTVTSYTRSCGRQWYVLLNSIRCAVFCLLQLGFVVCVRRPSCRVASWALALAVPTASTISNVSAEGFQHTLYSLMSSGSELESLAYPFSMHSLQWYGTGPFLPMDLDFRCTLRQSTWYTLWHIPHCLLLESTGVAIVCLQNSQGRSTLYFSMSSAEAGSGSSCTP